MRQLFKRTRVLLPLLALLAVPATSFGQRSWNQRTDTIPGSRTLDGNPGWWKEPFQSANRTDWNSKAAATSKWHSNPECQAAMGYTRDAIQNADIRQSWGTLNIAGEYFGDADVIVIHTLEAMTTLGFGTLIEEAWHRSTGDSDSTLQALNDSLVASSVGRTIQECHDEAREEDDDEPCGAAADGMAADCGNPVTPTTTTCTEKLSWVPPLTIEVFVKPESSTLEQVPLEEPEDGWPSGDPVSIPGITVSAESKGQWVEVVIADGYWETVTECTES